MEPFHHIAKPVQDVTHSMIDESAYAASLGDLLYKSEAGRRYWDGEMFHRLTYQTKGLRQALEDIRLRLQEGRGNGFRQIETAFGGGKTHSMIAMFHQCKRWGAIPVVIDGGRLNASRQTIWGEIERQLDGGMHAMDGMIAPSEDEIYGLLHDRKSPILILMDEILPYVESAAGHTVGETSMAVQTNTFMQRLSGAVRALPNVCVVISLPDRDNAQEKELYDHLKNVAGRQRQLITVATESDMPHILRRRLFETDESAIQEGAAENIRTYVERCVRGKSIKLQDAASYAGDFASTYPLTPDVFDVLFSRWAAYPTFQRTRGALRLLSAVIHSLLDSERTEITPADIDLGVLTIRKEMAKHAGEHMERIVTEDITGPHAGTRNFREAGIRCARTILLYSFPRGGAGLAEIMRSVATDVISHSEVGDALEGLQKTLFHLELEKDTYRFTSAENINRIIQRAASNVSPQEMAAEELERLKSAAGGGMFYNVVVWPDAQHIIPDRPAIQLVILQQNDPERCRWLVNNVHRRLGRANCNALVFLMPAGGGRLAESIRMLLAVRRIRQTHPEMLKSNAAYGRRISAEESDAENYIPRGLREKYADVWLPARDGARRLDIMMADPQNDQTPIGSIVWDRLAKESEVHESFTSQLLDRYGGQADEAFRSMMRTPGERRPASLDVLLRAEPHDAEPYNTEPHNGRAGQTVDTGRYGHTDNHPNGRLTAIRCSCSMDRQDLGRLGALPDVVGPLSTTDLEFSIRQRADRMLDVMLKVDGDIDARTASKLRGLFGDGARWTQTGDWNE